MRTYLLLCSTLLILAGCADQTTDVAARPPAPEGQTFTPGAATQGNSALVPVAPLRNNR